MITLLVALAITTAGAAIIDRRRRCGIRRRLAPAGLARRRRMSPNLRSRLQRRPSPPGPSDVAAWCDALARCLRSGETLRSALSRPAEHPGVERALAPVHRELRAGVPVATASRAVAGAGGGALSTALAVIAAVADIGGATAAPLDRVAAALRAEAAAHAERRSHGAQARLSAIVMTSLPPAVLILLATTDAGVRHTLLTPLGAGCVTLGALLSAAGWWWMLHIIDGGTRG